ncbi:MAG TPA: hypothetical protein VFH95_00390 [Candidatus Kapabacteria bacterium]|nr:hypothetical protein [Candidatus Kapabacteria bacterium]
MAYLIVDEWLWEDLSRHKGTEKGKEAFQFLRAISQNSDVIVAVKGSKFLKKALDLCNRPDREAKELMSFFMSQFFFNSDNLLQVEQSQLPDLPKQFEATVKDDDHYLVQSYFLVEAEVLITTDSDLKDALVAEGLNCEWRDYYLPIYIQKYLHDDEP